jgi:hypothetical protein
MTHPQQQEAPISVAQAYAMAMVCLDLHNALGIKWGDDPYQAIAKLREAALSAGAVPQQEPQESQCEDGSCNPFTARCGKKFCTPEEKDGHDEDFHQQEHS